jgi:hypothetical protein
MKAIQLAIYLAIRYNEPEIVNILIKTIDQDSGQLDGKAWIDNNNPL